MLRFCLIMMQRRNIRVHNENREIEEQAQMMVMTSTKMGKVSFGMALLPWAFVVPAVLCAAVDIPGFG